MIENKTVKDVLKTAAWREFNQITDKSIESWQLPIPFAFAAKLLGVSQQRIAQLCKAGKLGRLDWGGSAFVWENSVRNLERDPEFKKLLASKRLKGRV